jgi:hypothetical protein
LEFLYGDPYTMKSYAGLMPGTEIVNAWGVTIRFQENTPGLSRFTMTPIRCSRT